MIKVGKLSNGLKIAVKEMPEMASCAIGIWIGAGGRYETPEISGISHFVEHMLFKGTKTRNCQQIKEEIEGIGGYLNAFTSEECTCYYSKIIAGEYKKALEVLADMVINPLFDIKDINQERGVIIEEINMYQDLPMEHVHDVLGTIMWPDHPLGMFLTGTVDTVNSFNKDTFDNYKKDYYTPNNIVIACAGNIKFEELFACAEKLFSNSKSNEIKPFKKFEQKQTSPCLKILSKKTEQTHLSLGLKSYSRFNELKYALGLLNIVLGGNMSSRLFKEVREERGLAYSIRSSVNKYHDTGVFGISAGVRNDKFNEAVALILEELNKIKQGVSSDELERAKKYYTGNFLMGLEKTAERMLFLGETVLSMDEKQIKTPNEIVKKINNVTLEDVKHTANDIIKNENLNLAVIGPIKSEDEISNIFKL
jgi:predicted Zn-dependent peptidase